MLADKFKVQSPNVRYTDKHIVSEYTYRNTEVRVQNGDVTVVPKETEYTFKTETKVPRLGYLKKVDDFNIA